MNCGIYRISAVRHDGPTRYYIGQAANIAKRWRTHLRQLRAGTHWNLGMQIDFAKYGERSFAFGVLIVCEPKKDVLAMYEQIAVNAYDPAALYNIRVQCVTSGLGTKASPERRAKVSASLKGIRRSDETKAAVSRAQAWKHTLDGRARMSVAAKRRAPPSEETRQKMRASTSFRNLSQEARAKGVATRALNKAVLQRGSAWVLHG